MTIMMDKKFTHAVVYFSMNMEICGPKKIHKEITAGSALQIYMRMIVLRNYVAIVAMVIVAVKVTGNHH